MAFSLNLSQKGLLLVAVPLVFELGFLSALALLLQRAEVEARRAEKAQAVATAGTIANSKLQSAISVLAIYAFSRDEALGKRFGELLDETSEEFRLFRRLVAGNTQLADKVAKMDQTSTQALKLLEEGRRIIASRSGSHATSLASISAFRGRVANLVTEFAADMQAVAEAERRSTRYDPEREEKLRSLVEQFLGAGVCANIALAIGLAVYFNHGTISRLAVLMDNTAKLASERPLNPVIGGTDEIARLDETFHDMAATLTAARAKERAVVENAMDIICSLDSEQRFAAVNPAACQVLSRKSEELVERRLSEFVHEDDRARASTLLSDVALSGGAAHFEIKLIPGEAQDPVDTAWSVQWSAAERMYYCVAHDVSARKNMERLKQEFLAMVSHDLRTPLTTVQVLLAVVRTGMKGPLTPEMDKDVATAENNVQRMIGLVNQLLDLEKLEAGKLEMACDLMPLQYVISSSVDVVRALAEKKQVELRAPASALTIFADGERVVQILVNLLSNAIKFTPRESTVEIAAEEIDGWVEVKVTDAGPGIPLEHQEKVFERFHQVDQRDPGSRKGTGLGLPICKSMIKEMGGAIGVRSTPGRGSTFWFRLPALAPDEQS